MTIPQPKYIESPIYLRRILFLFFSLLLIGNTYASDQLIAAEYYVNTDPGKGNGTAIPTPDDGTFDGNLESITIEMPVNVYGEGYHTVYVRFKEKNGKWGTPKGMVFKVGLEKEFIYEITGAEYFVDTDPGKGFGTPISATEDGGFGGQTESVEIDLSAAGYSDGQHMIYVRFKDANGQWGASKGQAFTIKEDADFTYALSKAEYFIDTDPGTGNGTPVTISKDGSFDSNLESIELDVELNNLSDGIHMIYTRFQDNTGKWGAEKGFQFQVTSEEEENLFIQTAEYFINSDPGNGNGTVISAPSDGAFDEAVEELEATFNIDGLSVGKHFVYFRVKGSNGKWGPARGVPFQVENITILEKAEYFFNSDPGEGKGIPITASKDGSFNSLEEEVDLEIPVSGTGLAVGQHTLYLRFKNSKGEWSSASSKSFTVQTKPVIVVSTDTLNFGEHVVGDSLAQTFTVKNDGDGTLNISNITSSSPDFNVVSTTGSIPANSDEELTFTVNFEPRTAGSKNATLTIANNDQNKTIRLLGSALAKEPIAEFSTESLDFGTVLVGDSISKHVAIYNTGYDTLKVSNITVSSSEYKVNATAGTLAPGSFNDSLVVRVAFVPQSEGSKAATLSILGNIPTKQIPLSGTAELNPAPTIALSTDSLSFGAVQIGKDSTYSFQVRNLGTNKLSISSVTISGNAFSVDVVTPVDIERGSPLNVPVTFNPETATKFSGMIEIHSNDAANPKAEVLFSGEGTVGPPARLLVADPDSLNFGLVTQNSTSKKVITLSNEGNATLKISTITSSSGAFYLENAPTGEKPIFITAGSSENIEIVFKPSEGGNKIYSGELFISSDRTDSDDHYKISIVGTGVDQPTANIQLSAGKLDFGELRVGNKSTLSFTLTNGGNADLSVSGITISNSAFMLQDEFSAFVLTPSQDKEFELDFEPTSMQTYQAKLTIESNIAPAEIALSGKGVTLTTGVDSVEIKNSSATQTSGQSVAINITPTGLGGSGSAYIYYKKGGGGSVASYNKLQMQHNGSGSFSTSIPSSAVSVNGVSYWFEVTDGVEKVTSPAKDPHLNPYTIIVESPQGITKSSPQPAGTEQNYYRMISLPLDDISGAVDTVMSNFGEGSAESWRLFRWQSGKYVESTESGFENFAPGRGYWFITTKAASIKTGSGKSARTDVPYSIFLQPGWNMIGSPFAYDTDWNNAEKPAEIENLWSYDGSGFVSSSVLKPWEGYFVNNTSNNPVEVKLSPMEAVSGSGKMADGQLINFNLAEGWNMHINAESGIITDSYNYLGVQPNAENGKDIYDLRDAPKQPGNFLQLAFENGEMEKEKLSVDLKPLTDEGHFWDLEIHTNSKAETIDLAFKAEGKLPDDFNMWLIDKDQGTLFIIDRSEGFRHSLRTALGDTLSRNFRVVVGTDAFFKFNNLGVNDLPGAFILKQNYPNPFNPSTTIVFGIPEAAHVKLEIFDVLGRKVATLLDKKMDAGYYNQIWNASQAASGMYIYRLSAKGVDSRSGFTKIHKMTLIK